METTPLGQSPPLTCSALFEAADATNDEAYYTLGIWPTLAEAIAEISGCSDPGQLGSDGEHEEYCYVEIRQRKMGWSGIGKVVWKITWRAKYTDESDEYTWEVDADPLPNVPAVAPATLDSALPNDIMAG